MPLPTIILPKKQTVWRMWVLPVRETPWACATFWLPEGQQPSQQDAIRTDKTEEREPDPSGGLLPFGESLAKYYGENLRQ